jgi:hypothetical protein
LKLPIWVLCRENTDYQWTEKSRLIDVNQFGAGFTLTRPLEVGRLIQLTAPLPYQLRSFDQLEPMYSVWSLVRHVSVIQHQPAAFRVGVAFVGKRAPASYEDDPSRQYDPVPMNFGPGLMWRLTRRPLAKERRETRLMVPLEVTIETLDETGNLSAREYTVTETISSIGACVRSSLDVGVGRIVRISSTTDGVSVFAAIRSRTIMPDGVARLGLEFIVERWPLERESQFVYQNPPRNQSHSSV